nr:hypothetical protein [Streptomyces mirabilis]
MPSATLRATYVFVAGSSRIRISVIVCRARLSCRSPLRLIRCRLVSPEEAGIGETPANEAWVESPRGRTVMSHVEMADKLLIKPTGVGQTDADVRQTSRGHGKL